MRYRLRTLLIVMLLGGPLGAMGWKLWTSPEWESYRNARSAVEARTAEWRMAKARSTGSRPGKAAERHAELRYRRDDAVARETSALYRTFAPADGN